MEEEVKNNQPAASTLENEEDSKRPYPRLDYTITDAQERNKLVHEIVNSVSPEKLTPYYLE